MSYYSSTAFYDQNRSRQRARVRPSGFQIGFDFVPPATNAEFVHRVTRDFPTTEQGLIKKARETLKALDEAVRSGDEDHVDGLQQILDAIDSKLPERIPPEDIEEDDEWDPSALHEILAARPGTVPLWGQTGKFLVPFQGIKVVVHKNDLTTFHVTPFYFDRPFVSATGYRSYHHLLDDARGRSVKETVLVVLRKGQIEWNGKKKKLEALKEQSHWVYDEETDQDRPVITPPGPDDDDADWQPGGWLYELKRKA